MFLGPALFAAIMSLSKRGWLPRALMYMKAFIPPPPPHVFRAILYSSSIGALSHFTLRRKTNKTKTKRQNLQQSDFQWSCTPWARATRSGAPTNVTHDDNIHTNTLIRVCSLLLHRITAHMNPPPPPSSTGQQFRTKHEKVSTEVRRMFLLPKPAGHAPNARALSTSVPLRTPESSSTGTLLPLRRERTAWKLEVATLQRYTIEGGGGG